MALVSVTLCVERINFMFQRCNQWPAKSSFYLALNKCSENRANFLVSGPGNNYIGRANGTRLTTVAAADAIVGVIAAIAAFAGATPGANAGTQGIGRARNGAESRVGGNRRAGNRAGRQQTGAGG